VTTFKLPGIFISSYLSWDSHVTDVFQKVANCMYRIYCLVKIAGAPVYRIVCVFAAQ